MRILQINSTQFSALTFYYQVLLKSYKDKQKCIMYLENHEIIFYEGFT